MEARVPGIGFRNKRISDTSQVKRTLCAHVLWMDADYISDGYFGTFRGEFRSCDARPRSLFKITENLHRFE